MFWTSPEKFEKQILTPLIYDVQNQMNDEQMLQNFCHFLIDRKMIIWPDWFVFEFVVGKLHQNFHYFRHCECEFDQYCPFVILLKIWESQNFNSGFRNQSETHLLSLMDVHFSSSSHFLDFKSHKFKNHQVGNRISLVQRTRTENSTRSR